jgi:hypothetical protein
MGIAAWGIDAMRTLVGWRQAVWCALRFFNSFKLVTHFLRSRLAWASRFSLWFVFQSQVVNTSSGRIPNERLEPFITGKH